LGTAKTLHDDKFSHCGMIEASLDAWSFHDQCFAPPYFQPEENLDCVQKFSVSTPENYRQNNQVLKET